MDNSFDVSVIIPTYNRKEMLREMLGSLANQTWPAAKIEVIVVDDGSTDGTKKIIEETFSFTLRLICQQNQGSAVARNTGAEQAKGNILVFLDDDMLVEPEYIAGLVEEHQTYSRIVGMGKELPYVPPDSTPFAKLVGHVPQGNSVGTNGAFVGFTACVTNNISVERADFFEIGKMQDIAGDGPTWWGDVDFGYRAEQLGFRFRRSGRAQCYHRDYSIRDLKTTTTRYYHVARMVIKLFQKFPDLPPHIPMFHDKGPILWGQDSLGLIIRKSVRLVISSRPVLSSLEKITQMLESHYASPILLRPLYRWIVGGYIFQGYRDGLREYGPI